MVKLLIERGHEDEVRREAGQGDWFCARGVAGELDRRGEREAVMALLAPYVGTGWEEAAETAAGFLAGEGRADDVFALLGPRVGDSTHREL